MNRWKICSDCPFLPFLIQPEPLFPEKQLEHPFQGRPFFTKRRCIAVHDLWIIPGCVRTLSPFNPAIRVTSLGRIRKAFLYFNAFIIISASENPDAAPLNLRFSFLNRWKICSDCPFLPFLIQPEPLFPEKQLEHPFQRCSFFAEWGSITVHDLWIIPDCVRTLSSLNSAIKGFLRRVWEPFLFLKEGFPRRSPSFSATKKGRNAALISLPIILRWEARRGRILRWCRGLRPGFHRCS